MLTGLHGVGPSPEDLAAAFRRALLSEAEIAARGQFWKVDTDGLEPWLGDILSAA